MEARGGGGATGVESTPAPAVPADNPPIIAGGTREEFNVPENMTAVTSLSVVDGRTGNLEHQRGIRRSGIYHRSRER